MKKGQVKVFIFLHLLLMVYSSSNIFSKLASGEPFLSLRFCFYYGLSMVILFIYALGWQQIIKRLPLTTAFSNKAVTTIWGAVWGILFFGESITLLKAAGIMLIVAGIMLLARDEAQEDEMKTDKKETKTDKNGTKTDKEVRQ